MTNDNFKKRTSALRIPAHIYEKYDDIVKSCKSCQKYHPAPTRSRVSGMRATKLGDLLFIDHVEIRREGKSWLVLIVTDAASNLMWAGPHPAGTGYTIKNTIKLLNLCFDQWQIKPGAIVGDSYFMSRRWMNW